MANKTINDYPESTSPNGNWYVLVDDGTGCYKKVKLSNLPGGGPTSSTTTSTSSSTSSSSTSSSTSSSSTSTSTSSSTSSSSTSTSTSTSCVITDADAIAFIEAAAITSCTIKTGINTFVIGLKADGLWTKLRAVYPFVGGTASTHKFNLKNPADTDVAFRMTFTGGATHNANGVTFNGTTGYGDTKFDIADFPSSTNLSYGVYIRSLYNPSGTGFDFGVYSGGLVNSFLWVSSRRFYANTASGGFLTWPAYTLGDYYGFISGVIRSVSDTEVYKNGVSQSTGTTPNDTPALPGQNWFLGATNNGSGVPTDFSTNNYAFAYLSESLSDAEMGNLYTRVQALQTTLGRQV